MKKRIIIFILVFASLLPAQRLYKISVQINEKTENLSFINKNGIDFVSAQELANIFSAGQYYNKDVGKFEIKFKDCSIKFTAKNQFVSVSSKSGTQTVYQMPISTLLIKNEIFIPLIYCVDYISLCYGKKINYYDDNKNMVVTDEVVVFEKKASAKIETKLPPAAPVIKPTEPVVKPASSKYDIYGISIEDKSNGTLIRLKLNRKISVPKHSINKNTLFVFFNGVTVAPNLSEAITPAGFVNEIKNVNVSKNNTQLEISLKDGYASSVAYQDAASNDILITIHNKLFSGQPNIESAKSKWIFDAVVIDAGHGGKDPGAIGMTGIKEKVINLSVALKLGNLIEKNLPDVKVIYTRKTDEFVELYKRGKIANENGGKLFISIHCNSTEAKNITNRGFEVYLLRPGRTKQAISIAEYENSVIKYEDNPDRYQKLTDENFILVSMAHSQYMRFSEKFSDFLNQTWKSEVEIPSLGIKQAGFYVLVGASMPGVLIENGFLSNRKDETFLAGSSGQKEIAQSIFNTIKKYKEYYDKEIGN